MRWWILVLCVAFGAVDGWAHRVNIFAYVEGAHVVVECGYSKSKRVRGGTVEVFDASSGSLLLSGQTDEQGVFRFPVPEQTRATGTDVRLVLKAGEGHQAEWIVRAEELASAGTAHSETGALATPAAGGSVPLAVANTPLASAPALSSGLTRAELDEALNTALDAKLAPLQRVLREEREPGLREIIGEIGWIFGLVGVAAYAMSRRRV